MAEMETKQLIRITLVLDCDGFERGAGEARDVAKSIVEDFKCGALGFMDEPDAAYYAGYSHETVAQALTPTT